MSQLRSTTPFQLTEREHRWLSGALILGAVALAFVVIHFVTDLVGYFSDVIMIFFLAWLLAFILSPLASGLLHLFPRLPRAFAVIVVYSLLIVFLLAALIVVAQALYTSISSLIQAWPEGEKLRTLLQPAQDKLNSVGASQISLYDQVTQLLANLKNGAQDLVKPVGDIAFASLGIFGNLLFVFFLSLYMSVDRDHIVSFLFRLVPPGYKDEARLLEHSVARSFGGFLRGQALMGLMYGLISMGASLVLGLPYMPVTAVSSGVLQAIPFFGPFVSWTPPVLVAIFFAPEAVVPTLAIMVAGWFVLMNLIQPRLMSEAVGLNPVVVLGSVMIGSKLAGVAGAIFGIPVAAVVASFFFYYLGEKRTESVPVAVRAARRVEEREGRTIRIPREPLPGEDQEVEPGLAPPPPEPMARKGARPNPAPAQADPDSSAPTA